MQGGSPALSGSPEAPRPEENNFISVFSGICLSIPSLPLGINAQLTCEAAGSNRGQTTGPSHSQGLHGTFQKLLRPPFILSQSCPQIGPFTGPRIRFCFVFCFLRKGPYPATEAKELMVGPSNHLKLWWGPATQGLS